MLVSWEQKVTVSWEATAPLCPCCRELNPAWWGEVSWGRAMGNGERPRALWAGRPQATGSQREEGAAPVQPWVWLSVCQDGLI